MFDFKVTIDQVDNYTKNGNFQSHQNYFASFEKVVNFFSNAKKKNNSYDSVNMYFIHIDK